MRIYILADMEGTAGIWQQGQVNQESTHFQEGRELLTADINAAIEGAFQGGATEVVVCDTHGGGPNLVVAQLDPRVEYETPVSGSPMPSLDASFDGLFLTGHHARAGTLNGFLDHTMSSTYWFSFHINGQEVGEIGMETAHAGHFGVPLILVTGDEAACAEAVAAFPWVHTAAVKRGNGRNRARCLPLAKAHDLIRAAAANAVANASQAKPWQLTPPIELQLTFPRSDYADEAATRESIERVDARTVRRIVASADLICRAF